MLLLSIWSWEHLPVGRPTPGLWAPWEDHNDPAHFATWAYRWDNVDGMVGTSKAQYMRYSSEFDILTPEHVSSSSSVILFHYCRIRSMKLIINFPFFWKGYLGAIRTGRHDWFYRDHVPS